MSVIKCFNNNCNDYNLDLADHCGSPIFGLSSCDDAIIKKESTDKPRNFYLQVLQGEECQCGRSKKRGMALCYYCWCRLPKDVRVDLYSPMGEGFEEAYEAAIHIVG